MKKFSTCLTRSAFFFTGLISFVDRNSDNWGIVKDCSCKKGFAGQYKIGKRQTFVMAPTFPSAALTLIAASLKSTSPLAFFAVPPADWGAERFFFGASIFSSTPSNITSLNSLIWLPARRYIASVLGNVLSDICRTDIETSQSTEKRIVLVHLRSLLRNLSSMLLPANCCSVSAILRERKSFLAHGNLYTYAYPGFRNLQHPIKQ